MAARKVDHSVAETIDPNTRITINGEKFKFWDPIMISLGLPDIITPVMGFNTSLHLLLFATAMTRWYHLLSGVVGGLGILASMYFLFRTIFNMLTQRNTGKVPTLIHAAV
jgi:hypothetical protein